MPGIRPIGAALATWAVRLAFGLVALVAVLSIVFIAFDVFIEDREDTTALSNVVFATSLAISSVAFGLSRAVDPTGAEKTQERIARAGELLFFGSLLFLIATMLKYVSAGIDARLEELRALPAEGAIHQVILGSSRMTFAVAFAFLIGGFCLLLYQLSRHLGMR